MGELFHFQMSPWELILRGTIVYWFLFLLFRFFLRRELGSLGLADVLLIVLIADASQNGMSGEYKSVGEGMVLVATIGGWNFAIDWMSFHYAWFARFAEPRSLSLIRHGRIQWRNARRELLTQEEIESQLRQNGIDDIQQVKHAWLEPDGQVSFLRYSSGKEEQAQQRPRSQGPF